MSDQLTVPTTVVGRPTKNPCPTAFGEVRNDRTHRSISAIPAATESLTRRRPKFIYQSVFILCSFWWGLDGMKSSVTFNGRPFRAGDFERELMRATCEAVKSEMYHRFAAIRHPETGEFPTVRVLGDELDDLRLSVEGSQALLECVAARMSDDERKAATLMPMERVGPPRAFLSYSFEDGELAERVARKLRESGVDAWWAEWEIRAGDSLRQKIDGGLERCSHFIVLLTPSALLKPWVQQEMDAGLVRRIAGKARFIALRAGLPARDLPPLLSGMLSPEIGEDFERSVRDLINDIHEVTRKPTLGPAPSAVTLPKTDFSPTATAVAKSFVEGSPNGEFGDFQQDVDDLVASIGVSAEDIEDALYELRDHVSESHGNVMAKSELYAAFDGFFKDWKPDQDALASRHRPDERPGDADGVGGDSGTVWLVTAALQCGCDLARNPEGGSLLRGDWVFALGHALGREDRRDEALRQEPRLILTRPPRRGTARVR